MKPWSGISWFVAMLVAGACTSSEREDTRGRVRCSSPGRVEICACPDATEGEQECREDGTFGPCDCGSTPGSGGEGGQGGGARGGANQGGASGSAGSSSAGMAGEAGGDSEGGTAGGGATAGAGAGAGGATAGGDGTAGGGGSTSGGPCRAGDIAGCRCPDDALSYRTCENAAFSACVCASSMGTGGSGTCAPTTEICNRVDDDCNGVADDHFACPDDTVASTKAFSRSVYLQGRLSALCSDGVLQRFWPTLGTPLRGFGCLTDFWLFRKSDEVLFYFASGRVYQNGTGTGTIDDVELPTPACSLNGGTRFGFDDTKTLHYQCGDLLYRGDGELIAGSIDRNGIVGVLDDGRIVVLRESPSINPYFIVLNPDGRELLRFPPPGLFTGTLTALPRATTLDGNTAYLALRRDYGGVREYVAYALDESSNFRLVRRLVLADAVDTTHIVPDGTFFFSRYDSSNGGYVISAYFPNNTNQIVWRAADSPGIDTTNIFELVVGPR